MKKVCFLLLLPSLAFANIKEDQLELTLLSAGERSPYAKMKGESAWPFEMNPALRLYSSDWGIESERAGIRLRAAWEKFKEDKMVVVALIGEGIDPRHPLSMKMCM